MKEEIKELLTEQCSASDSERERKRKESAIGTMDKSDDRITDGEISSRETWED